MQLLLVLLDGVHAVAVDVVEVAGEGDVHEELSLVVGIVTELGKIGVYVGDLKQIYNTLFIHEL